MSWNQYPGQGQHQQGGGGYARPPPPPPQGQWGAPPPPPQQYGYAPPPPQNYGGPPPGGYQGGGYQGGGYQGGGGYDNRQSGYHNGGGGYAPPTGQPPPQQYHPTGAGYQPPNTIPPQGQYGQYGHVPARPPTSQQQYGPQFQGGNGPNRPFFQYSQCTGKRKALLVGINYFNQSGQLNGCINDAHNVQKFLCERHNYRPEDIVILTDDSRNSRQIPTRANIIQAIGWLVQGAQPNDALFFHYSGHGGQTADLDGDEDDGYDEVIYPVDFKQAGHIVDDECEHDRMVKPLPAGCRLTAIFDSCHSGSALDLPYIYSTEGTIKEPNLLAEAGQGLLGAGMSYLRGDLGGVMSGVMSLGKKVMNQNSGARERTKQTKTSPADVIMWSGCKDSQTSADTSEAGKATGAMSFAFIAALNKNPQQSYVQLLNSIREELRGRYDQKPQLSSSHPIDTNLLFIC